MAEIHVEKKPRSGWIWLVILLLVLVIGAAAWYFWPQIRGAGTAEPATATSPPATTVTEGPVGGDSLPPAPEIAAWMAGGDPCFEESLRTGHWRRES